MVTVKHFVPNFSSIQYLGFGAWQAWSMLCYVDGFLGSELIPIPFGQPYYQPVTSVLFSICSISLTMTIISLAFTKKIDRWLQTTWFPASGAISGAIATIAIFLASSHILDMSVFYVACIIAGVGNAIICLSYAPIIGGKPFDRSLLEVCYAMIVCCIIYFIAATAPFVIKCCFCTACLLIGGLLPALNNSVTTPSEEEFQKLSLIPQACRFFIAVFVLAFASSLIRNPLFSIDRNSTDGWDSLGVFIVLVVCSCFVFSRSMSRRSFSIPILYYSTSVLVIVFLLVMSICATRVDATVASLASMPRTLLNVATDAIFFGIIYQSKMSPAKIMGLGHGLKSLGILLGGIAGIVSSPLGEYRIVFYSAVVLAVVIAIVLIAPEHVLNTVLIPIDDKDSDAERGQDDEEALESPKNELEDEHTAAQRPPAGKRLWRKRCEEVCSRYLLSPRESEVLYLLSLGHGSEFISNELVISLYTARTHTRNIYSKTGVHSREELIKLVRETETDEG